MSYALPLSVFALCLASFAVGFCVCNLYWTRQQLTPHQKLMRELRKLK